MKKMFVVIIFVFLLIGMPALVFNIQPVKAWTGVVYIRADGSIDPPTAPIQREGDYYTLTGNIGSDADGIVVERDNVTIDGAGYTVQGAGSRYGIFLHGRSNVTIRNINVKNFECGVYLWDSEYNSICGSNITNNGYGIYLY